MELRVGHAGCRYSARRAGLTVCGGNTRGRRAAPALCPAPYGAGHERQLRGQAKVLIGRPPPIRPFSPEPARSSRMMRLPHARVNPLLVDTTKGRAALCSTNVLSSSCAATPAS